LPSGETRGSLDLFDHAVSEFRDLVLVWRGGQLRTNEEAVLAQLAAAGAIPDDMNISEAAQHEFDGDSATGIELS